MRLPDTVMVQEKLPPGAAAVVLNKSHSYTDIYLPLDTHQKTLFDADRWQAHHRRDRPAGG